jgi:glutathione synthase/RimK-type ligase-like ATP-grasp enzyme
VAIRIALATSPGSDLISKDDEILAAALRRRGAIVEIPNWSDSSVDWSNFDLVAIRTTWDYQLRLGEFLSWASRVSETTKLVNDFSLLEWNAHKSYMLDLASSGVPTVPTVVLTSPLEIGSALRSLDCEKVVIKPEVGASATDAEVHSAQNIDAITEHVKRLTENGKALMQPFLSRVQTEGELSLAWIDGRVVHAIRKMPTPGDFRVQVEHGGSNVRVEPPDDALEIAKKCIDVLSGQPVFARVDCVRDDKGTLRLMELELIEPELMFEWAPESADILAARFEHMSLPAASH